MPKIFISYRRADNPYIAGLVYERLVSVFGENSIFYDVDSIPVGVDFRAFIKDRISNSDVVIVVIGKHWLDAQDEHGERRLDQSTDFVRLEVEAALKMDPYVIPVLVDGASPPKESELPDPLKELAYRNATQIRAGRDMVKDLDQLVKDIHLVLGDQAPPETEMFRKDQSDPAQRSPIASSADSPTFFSRSKINRLLNFLMIVSLVVWIGVNALSWINEGDIWIMAWIFWTPLIVAIIAYLLKIMLT